MILQEGHAGDDVDELGRCRRLLSAAAAAVTAVVSFRGRWSAVASTVSRLSFDLDDIAVDDRAASHPLVQELLRSLDGALTQTLSLAAQCRSPDPPSGKLRTQSDIAVAASALDQIAADVEVLLRSDALLDTPGTAERAPPPPEGFFFSESFLRESVRAEARGLVTRLQIGSSASRAAALDALLTLLQEDDKNVVIAAGQGVVPALVRLLDSAAGGGGGEVREKATAAIARISAVESCRHLLEAEGAGLLNHLARVIESEGAGAKEKACTALQPLTLAKDNAISVSSRGGTAALLEICRVGTPSAQAAAAAVLKNLAAVPELGDAFLEENGVPVLIGVLASGTPAAQANAVHCLCNLSTGEDSHSLKLAIFKEGALEFLKNYFEGGSANDRRNLEPAIGLLRNLSSFRYIAEIIANNDFLPRIVNALDSPNSATRIQAARTVADLGATVGKTRKEMGEAVPRLVWMLESKAKEKEAATMALASLMSVGAYRKLFKKEEKGIVNVVQLLDPSVTDVNKKYAISLLVSISHSRKRRKQMAAAGACGFLQRLVGMEVDGAKRLLEILGRGEVFGVFPRT